MESDMGQEKRKVWVRVERACGVEQHTEAARVPGGWLVRTSVWSDATQETVATSMCHVPSAFPGSVPNAPHPFVDADDDND